MGFLFGAKYLIAQLAITIIVKEGEHNISEVVGELNMSNSPAKKGKQFTRKRVPEDRWVSARYLATCCIVLRSIGAPATW